MKLKEIERIRLAWLGGFINSHSAMTLISETLNTTEVENVRLQTDDGVHTILDKVLISWEEKA